MSDERVIRAVIADDHGIVRAGLVTALSQPDLISGTKVTVVGQATNGLEAIEVVKRLKPDLLMLDISMPLASGAEILTDLRRWSPNTKIVVLTAITSAGLLSQIVAAGVDGVFAKGSDAETLVKALPVILRGGKVVDPTLVELIREAEPQAALTARERQTLNMVIMGKTNAEIGELMGISARTAEKHRASMMAKLGVRTLPELMAKALQDGLIEQQNLS